MGLYWLTMYIKCENICISSFKRIVSEKNKKVWDKMFGSCYGFINNKFVCVVNRDISLCLLSSYATRLRSYTDWESLLLAHKTLLNRSLSKDLKIC